jgi:hypothetical protein
VDVIDEVIRSICRESVIFIICTFIIFNIVVENVIWRQGEGVDWIDLAQDWGKWRVLVNTIRNLRFT